MEKGRFRGDSIMTRRLKVLASFALIIAFAQRGAAELPEMVLAEASFDAAKLRVHFIDIGPGLAILIETPGDRRHVFVDGGKWSLDDLLTYLAKFLPTSAPIDIGIVTHADSDHYRGMQKVFTAYQVKEFWYTGYESTELAGVAAWPEFKQQVVDEDGCASYVPLRDHVAVGDTRVIDDGGTPSPADDVIVRFLNVDRDPPVRDQISGRAFDESQRRNNASLVFKMTYKNVSFLITGDINGRDKEHTAESTDNEIDSEELELWVRHTLYPERYSLKATVLQAPHHGSNGSCSLHFLKAVAPEWIVIPAGHQYNHPDPATLRRITKAGLVPSKVLRTDEGDSTPETPDVQDPRGDDSYVFQTDGDSLTVTKVRMRPAEP
jgi:competence protein ComEC